MVESKPEQVLSQSDRLISSGLPTMPEKSETPHWSPNASPRNGVSGSGEPVGGNLLDHTSVSPSSNRSINAPQKMHLSPGGRGAGTNHLPLPTRNNSNPTGAEMHKRNEKHKIMVEETMHNIPQATGDDNLLYFQVLRKYYWRIVRISMKDGFSMTCASFKDFFMLPSFESIRRRRQEIQAKEKKKILRGEITSSDLLPTERTIRKRKRNENAQRHYQSNGQLSISDYSLED